MEERRDPHTCAGCGAHFEVGYGEGPEDTNLVLAEIACPRCGKSKGVSVPEPAVGRLLVELDEDEEVDEGAGD